MKKKKVYWASFDVDGSYDLYVTDGKVPGFTSHQLGPFKNLRETKRAVVNAFKFCIQELKHGIDGVKSADENDVIGD